MKIFYDIPYMKEIMKYVLIPVAVVIVLVGLALFIYSKTHKDHDNPYYNFVMNFWSSLIGIIVTGAILAIAVGFSIAMTEKMREYGLVEEKKMLYYLLKYFVIIPFVFVVWYIVKFLKTIYYKPSSKKEKLVQEKKESEALKEPSPVSSPVESIEKEVEPVTLMDEENSEKELPPIEESIQEEMKQFEQENEEKEEPEII